LPINKVHTKRLMYTHCILYIDNLRFHKAHVKIQEDIMDFKRPHVFILKILTYHVSATYIWLLEATTVILYSKRFLEV
jgi:hypothetical protein